MQIYWKKYKSFRRYHHFHKKYNLPGMILCIDFKKVFDSLYWNFLLKTLEEVNFVEKIFSYVRTF